jgi:predicted phage replisome organizer
MADVKWIKITTDIFDDEKILMIESMPSADSIIVVWFKLLAFAGKQNNDGVFLMSNRIAYTDEMLASIFRREVNTIRLALKVFEQFGMIEIVDNVITIPNWNKHQTLDAYEKKKQRDRLYQQERRAAQRALIGESSDTSPDTSSDVAISDKEEDKEKEREEDKKKKERKTAPRESTLALFNRLLPDYILPPALQGKMAEWIAYKTERNERYKETGMKSLLRKVENNQLTYGSDAVCSLIDDCMANNWAGIIFDKLENNRNQPRKAGNNYGSNRQDDADNTDGRYGIVF